jgi:hypothetical protein
MLGTREGSSTGGDTFVCALRRAVTFRGPTAIIGIRGSHTPIAAKRSSQFYSCTHMELFDLKTPLSSPLHFQLPDNRELLATAIELFLIAGTCVIESERHARKMPDCSTSPRCAIWDRRRFLSFLAFASCVVKAGVFVANSPAASFLAPP